MTEAASIVCAVRVRPFNSREMRFNSTCCVEMTGNTTTMLDKRGGPGRDFPFDFAFWTHDQSEGRDDRPFASQEYVYDRIGKPILDNCFAGLNGALFAYGQTGSGKTFSVLGCPSDPGVLPRLSASLFQEIATRSQGGVSIRVECSFCEIYNEVVQDLLSATGPVQGGLKVRQDPKTGIFVQGLSKATTTSAEQFDSLLDRALSNRAVAATNMNAVSSRSHAIVLVSVVQVEAATSCTRSSRLSIIDLAGSERAESTGATGSTMREAQNINYSLSVLGMCLSRLADIAEGRRGLHVPFRDSQLTWLLSENLGGNSKTSMLAAISPADVNYEETLSTLRFASVTKRVKTVAVVNESANDKLIRELRAELADLQGTLQALRDGGATAPTAIGAGDDGTGAAGDGGDGSSAQDLVGDSSLQPTMSVAEILAAPAQTLDDVENAVSASAAAATTAGGGAAASAAGGGLCEPVDWKAPQFMDLSADSSSGGRSRGIVEGTNRLRFSGSSTTCEVTLSGLTGEVRLTVVDGTDVLHNNTPLAPGATVRLHQNDRIVAGDDVLRFSHYQALMDEEGKSFQTEPVSERHCELLESYYRALIAKEAMSTFLELLDRAQHELVAAYGPVSQEIDVDDDTPAPHRSLLLAIEDAAVLLEMDEQMLNSEAFTKESVLSEEFAQVDQTEEFNIAFDAAAHEAAMAEQAAAVSAKAAELKELEQQMAQLEMDREDADVQNIVFTRTSLEAAERRVRDILASAQNDIDAMGDAARAAERAFQEQLDESASERVLEVELAYHKEVRQQRNWRAAPADAEDLVIFRRQATIQQNDARLNCVRCGEAVEVLDPAVSQTEFAVRTVCLSHRFIYIFKKLYRREPLLFCMYIPGATTTLTAEGAGRFVIDFTAACARSPATAATSPSERPMIRLAFKDLREARAWRQWIEDNANPTPPLSIWRRKLETEVAEHSSSSTAGAGAAAGAGGGAGTVMAIESLPGKPFEMKGWAPDDSTTKCTRCEAEFGFFRRKHHCRTCGEIFCSTCLDSKKVCVACQNITVNEADAASASLALSRHEHLRVIARESTASFVERGKYFALYQRARILRFATRRDLDDFAVSLIAQQQEEDDDLGLVGAVARMQLPGSGSSNSNPNANNLAATFRPYLIDLFRGRFHEWCSVDISHVWRCSFHPLAVNIKLQEKKKTSISASASAENLQQQQQQATGAADDDGAPVAVVPEEEKYFVAVVCTSVLDRERLFEALTIMLGRRGYSPIRSGVGSNQLDVLVVDEQQQQQQHVDPNAATADASSPPVQQRTCAIRLTNQLRSELRIRVSHQVQGVKFHFQQGDFDIIAATCMNHRPPWTQQYLRSASMVALCDPMPLSPSTSLFVAADQFLAQHTTPPVTASARGICVVAFGVHESNLMLVASTASDVAEFEDVHDEEHSRQFVNEVDAAESGEESTRQSGVVAGGGGGGGGGGAAAAASPSSSAAQQQSTTSTTIATTTAAAAAAVVREESTGRASTRAEPGSLSPQADVWSPSQLPPPNDQHALLYASALPLDNLVTWPLKDVDPVEQFENVFVIGHNVQMSRFSANDKSGIQFRSSDGQLVREAEGHVEASIQVPQLILTALRMQPQDTEQQQGGGAAGGGGGGGGTAGGGAAASGGDNDNAANQQQMPAHINVKVLRLNDSNGSPVRAHHDKATTLVVNMPFERCASTVAVEAGVTNLSMTGPSGVALTGGLAIADEGEGGDDAQQDGDGGNNLQPSSSAAAVHRVGNTIRLLDRVAEHRTSKSLFVTVAGYGTAVVPFHQFAAAENSGSSATLTVPVMHCGIQTALVDLSISMFA